MHFTHLPGCLHAVLPHARNRQAQHQQRQQQQSPAQTDRVCRMQVTMATYRRPSRSMLMGQHSCQSRHTSSAATVSSHVTGQHSSSSSGGAAAVVAVAAHSRLRSCTLLAAHHRPTTPCGTV